MPANFDWQTDEDERRKQEYLWDESDNTTDELPSGQRRNWRALVAALALMVMAGAIIWWRVDRRLDATLQSVQTDVIASHNLVQRAVAEDDEEIFRSVLSGRMPAWTAGQVKLFREKLFFDRTPFGLTPAEGSLPVILPEPDEETPAEERVATVELSPDLNEAMVIVEHPYRINPTSETVTLRHTSIFRRGGSRWLLSPPLEDFWGDWVTREGEYLSLIYPQRDEAIAARLADDLDAEIGRMCNTLDSIACSADLYLTVRLDTDPDTLASLAVPLGPFQRAREQGDILELPTPTLVGLPIEEDEQQRETGYNVLLSGYARQVLGAAIIQAVGWRCCDDALLFSTLLEYQMGELDIVPWPITTGDYQRVLDSRIRLSDLSNYLRTRFPTEITGDKLWELRAAVDFLVKGVPGSSAAGLQRILDRTNNFGRFLVTAWESADVADRTPLPENIDLAWWLFAIDSAQGAAGPPPLPVDEDLYLSCSLVDGNRNSGTSSLWGYLPDENTWSEKYGVEGFIWMSALADPEMLMLQEFALEGQSFRTNAWRDGEISRIFIPGDEGDTVSFGESDSTGRKLVAYRIDPDTGIAGGLVIDLTTCDEGCAGVEMPGRPFWSPDGQSAIYLGGNDSFPDSLMVSASHQYILLQSTADARDLPLVIGPGDAAAGSSALTSIGSGRSPFWLDNHTYGFVRRVEGDDPLTRDETEIVMATLKNPTPVRLITAADLFARFPENIPQRGLAIGYVATHPRQPDRLFIIVLDESGQRAYVITYDLATGLAELRLQLLYSPSHSLSFSPDGHYLVMTGQDRNGVSPGESSAVLLVHNIAENTTIPLMSRLPFFLPSVMYDWTEDGRWLAIIMEDNLIGLVAPDEGYTHLLPRTTGECSSVAWLRE